MKSIIATLALILLSTLQVIAPVHADEKVDEKTRIINSLLVPLSTDETRQLEELVKATESTATIEVSGVSEKSRAARVALDKFVESKRERLPLAISKAMERGAVSLSYEKIPSEFNGLPIVLHLSVETERGKQGHKSYTLNVFRASTHEPDAKYRQISWIPFDSDRRITGIELVYLKPFIKQRPMVLLSFRTFRSLSTTALIFPYGWQRGALRSYHHGQFKFSHPNQGGSFVLRKRSNFPSFGAVGFDFRGLDSEDWDRRYSWNGSQLWNNLRPTYPTLLSSSPK